MTDSRFWDDVYPGALLRERGVVGRPPAMCIVIDRENTTVTVLGEKMHWLLFTSRTLYDRSWKSGSLETWSVDPLKEMGAWEVVGRSCKPSYLHPKI